MDRTPPAFRYLINRTSVSIKTYQYLILILTFLAYTSYHATRKTTSIVKTVLDPATNNVGMWFHSNIYPRATTGGGWAPFDGPEGTSLLGILDLSFLAVYSIGMYFAGHLGDRLDLRIFLTIGMIGTSIFTSLFGVGYWLNIHAFGYFLVVQMLAGLFQSTGWPSVVAVVGNWHGKRKRGLIMGIWNAHTSIGNISGSLIASLMLNYGWGWSFVVPSLLMAFVGLVLFVLLPPGPESVGLNADEIRNGVREPLLGGEGEGNRKKREAVGFWAAWQIPGVTAFAFGLFFSKLVAYTFLYWLPFYISHTKIGGEYLSNWKAGMLSTLFDVGGILGGILAGQLSDSLDARAFTSVLFNFLSMGALFIYRYFGSSSLLINASLMIVTGMFVNGPYALITTAVSADLGTHESLRGDSRALATVTAIIDGTGSAGAAIGPLLTGYISSKSWDAVFGMLMVSAFFAGLLLAKLACAEIKSNEQLHFCFRGRNSSRETANGVSHLVSGV
ncbi:putative glycerol-3-phosphate transporter 1 [Carex littledalei]|uniref:Putative glycerol-3-phosphate transporter 1 n=1 Tax=Carex littledalei TaxID=544730 RepID=A0A833R9V3_9POAL|nr:putative glycerol-3-phosphate transporter 1 [Carex littledalei]